MPSKGLKGLPRTSRLGASPILKSATGGVFAKACPWGCASHSLKDRRAVATISCLEASVSKSTEFHWSMAAAIEPFDGSHWRIFRIPCLWLHVFVSEALSEL